MMRESAAIFLSLMLWSGCGKDGAGDDSAAPLADWQPSPWGVCQVGCGDDKPVQLAAGYLHTCARMKDGTVRCWGDDSAGQLAGSTRIAPIPNLSHVVDISAGSYHTCALTDASAVYCWGANGNGQLGDDSVLPRSEVVRVRRMIGKTARRIFSGGQANCAVLSDGSAVCWGAIGSPYAAESPTFWAKLGGDIAEVAIGGSYLVRNNSGEVRWLVAGQGLITTPIAILNGAVSLSSGQQVDLVVMPNGELRGFGYAQNKKIGTDPQRGDFFDFALPYPAGVTACTTTCAPTAVTWATGVARAVLNKSSSSEPVYACLLMTDGTVSCWGHNNIGQQGNGRIDPRIGAYYSLPVQTPQPVAGLSDIKDLVVGSSHACALDGQSRVYCWGDSLPSYPSSKLGAPAQTRGSPPGAPLVFTP